MRYHPLGRPGLCEAPPCRVDLAPVPPTGRLPALVLASLAAAALALSGCGGDAEAQVPVFTLASPDLPGGSIDTRFVLDGFGCTGANVSPALEWANVPPGTRSLALQVHDPDAPTGSGFWHWAVYDIPPTATGLARGAGNGPAGLPSGAYGGNTDFLDTGLTGANGNYGGPCPPAGDPPHRYVFTLYALGVDQVARAGGIPRTGSAALYSFVMNRALGPQLLGKATFTATFAR